MAKKNEKEKEVCETCGRDLKPKEDKHDHKKEKAEKEDRSVICEFC